MTAKATQTVPPIVELMRRIDHIDKGGTNDHHKYKFRGIDQILDALGPVVRELGMYTSTKILKWDFTPWNSLLIHMEITFYNPDGTVATTYEALGEGKDGQDKSAYKATSGAEKYALGHGLLIPFESDDPDASNGDGGKKASGPSQATVTSGEQLDELRRAFEEALKEAEAAGVTISDKAREYKSWNLKQVNGALNKMHGLIAEAKA